MLSTGSNTSQVRSDADDVSLRLQKGKMIGAIILVLIAVVVCGFLFVPVWRLLERL
jgi:hypothetical protein